MGSIYNVSDPFGRTDHIDENGNLAGYSLPGLSDGSVDHFGPNGEYLGTSYEGFFGMTNHCGADGSNMGFSTPGLFDGMTDHFNASGDYAGTTYQGLFGAAMKAAMPISACSALPRGTGTELPARRSARTGGGPDHVTITGGIP